MNAESLGTNAGLAAAVLFITNGFRTAFNWNPKWLGLVFSVVLTVGVQFFQTTGMPNGLDLIVAFCNSFVVFASAVGGNSILGMENLNMHPKVSLVTYNTLYSFRHRFFSSWF